MSLPVFLRSPIKIRLIGFIFALFIYSLYYPATHYALTLTPIDVSTSWDHLLPCVPFFMLIYAMIYPTAIFPLFIVGDVELFKRIIYAYCCLEIVTLLCFFIFPVHMSIRPSIDSLVVDDFWDWCLCLCYYLDQPTCCFPSLHVSTSTLSALCCLKVNRKWGYFFLFIASSISISTLLVKQHFIADVLLGVSLAYLFYSIFVKSYHSPNAKILLPTIYSFIPFTLFIGILITALYGYQHDWQPWYS